MSKNEVIPNADWTSHKLGDFVEVRHGYAFKGKFISDEPNDNILVTPGNFKIGGGFKSDKLKFYHGKVPKEFLLKPGDIIITMTDLSKEGDTLGYSAKVPLDENNYLHNQRIGLVKFENDGLNKNYFYWLTRSKYYQKSIVRSSTGSTVRHTAPKRIKAYRFNKPPLDEQQAIADALTAFDQKIELLQEQNKTLENLAQTLFKEWFGKYQVGDELPEGWKVGKLGYVTKSCGGTTPRTKISEYWDGEIYWSSPKDLSNSKGMFLLSTQKRITEKGLSKISSGLLPKGTLLLSSRAPVGYLSLTNIDLAINQGYIALLEGEYFNNRFMYLWLSTFMDLVKSAANGSTFLEISKSSFRKIPCVVPEEIILKKFDNIVSPIFEKILSNTLQMEKLQNTRDTLLPKLMNGSVRIKGF